MSYSPEVIADSSDREVAEITQLRGHLRQRDLARFYGVRREHIGETPIGRCISPAGTVAAG